MIGTIGVKMTGGLGEHLNNAATVFTLAKKYNMRMRFENTNPIYNDIMKAFYTNIYNFDIISYDMVIEDITTLETNNHTNIMIQNIPFNFENNSEIKDLIRKQLEMINYVISNDLSTSFYLNITLSESHEFYNDALMYLLGEFRTMYCKNNVGDEDFIKPLVLTSDVHNLDSRKDIKDILIKYLGRVMVLQIENEIHQLYIIYKCAYGAIISNQNDTLSWWGSYLNNYNNKLVLCSKTWKGPGDFFQDYSPHHIKLFGDCPPICWINLKKYNSRRIHMESIFSNYTNLRARRIEAFDGSIEQECIIAHPVGTAKENACTASHILAMKTYLEEFPHDDILLIMEDDVSFMLCPFWKKTLREYINIATNKYGNRWEIIQLCAILLNKSEYNHFSKEYPIVKTSQHWFSTVSYVIKRTAAERFVNKYYRNGSFHLNDDKKVCVNADVFIYDECKTLILPLFTNITSDFEGNTKTHAQCRESLIEFWQNEDSSHVIGW